MIILVSMPCIILVLIISIGISMHLIDPSLFDIMLCFWFLPLERGRGIWFHFVWFTPLLMSDKKGEKNL